MTAPAPRTIADLDVSVEVLVAAMAKTHSPSDRIAWSLDAYLMQHPEVHVSTDADYPGWVPGQAVTR